MINTNKLKAVIFQGQTASRVAEECTRTSSPVSGSVLTPWRKVMGVGPSGVSLPSSGGEIEIPAKLIYNGKHAMQRVNEL